MAAFWMMRCLSCALTTCSSDSMLLRAATWYRSSIFLEQQVGPLVWQTCRSAPGRKSAETGWRAGWAEWRSCKSTAVSTTEAQFIIFCKLNAENTVYHRFWTLISGLFLCSAHVTQCTAEVKNKLLLEDELFWCTVLQQGWAALLRDQFGQQKLFHHSRLHFLLRGSKIIALFFGNWSEREAAQQTSWGLSMVSLCIRIKKQTSKIEKAAKQHLYTWLCRMKVVYTDKTKLNCFWKVQTQASKL